MDAIEALQSRNTAPRLTGEVPPETLDEILKCGLRAPDHAQLRPWRFVVVEGKGRERLGALFAQAALTSDPDKPREQLEKLKGKPLRAPVIVVVAAKIVEHPKVPESEQLLSAGAAAQNILLAAHAFGLGAMWRTGEMAYDNIVREGLGLKEDEQVIAHIYIGEIDGKQKKLPDHDLSEFVTRW